MDSSSGQLLPGYGKLSTEEQGIVIQQIVAAGGATQTRLHTSDQFLARKSAELLEAQEALEKSEP